MIDSVHVWCWVCFLLYPCPTWQQLWESTEWEWKLRWQNKTENFFSFLNNINHKPLKRLPFIQTRLPAWGHWEQGNHSSSRSSSDLRKPTWLGHRLGIYSMWKNSLRKKKGELFSSLKLASYLIFVSKWGNEATKRAGLTSCPRRAQLKWQKHVMRTNAWQNPQQGDAEAKLKAVSSYGQGPLLLYVCSASSTIGFSRSYCNTKNKQYSYSKKSVSSVLRQFVKKIIWLGF